MNPTTEIRINQMYFKVLPCASKDGDLWKLINNKVWDPETFEFFRNFVRPDKSVIDIGGWIGTTTLQAYAYNPKQVYSIEADPANFQTLKHNIAMNYAGDKIKAFNACLTDKQNANKIIPFGTANEEKPNSSSHRIDNGSRVMVKTINALPFLKKNCNLRDVNCINADIEGSERYLTETFKYLSTKNIAILLSLHPPFWGKDKGMVVPELLKSFQGYKIICPFEYKEINNLKERMFDDKFFPVILKSKER